MTDYQKLLSEARLKIEHYAAYREEQKLDTNHEADLLSRISAALAEPVEPVAIGEVKESGVVWANQNPHAYPIGTKFYAAPAEPVEPVALPFAVLDEEMAALRRFHETAGDEGNYDVPKSMMSQLADIGLLRHISGGIYEETTFGMSVLNGDFSTPADQDRVDAERLDWLERNVIAIRDIGWINGPLRDAIDRARSAK